ncbi:hypothetical protein QU487_20725 [Crenobacter sp. SG2305]|uniref:hypothetical protein n=1 Tax=Crenobacter oryzisoli TaxID=3056844 RepID=UPI0025AB0D63|nr:hypothetical protein [Crenobacter sp. SG2305]MDN0085136.1 hypothetical protein [Crenobacter sp. SG2305]
MKIWQQSRWQPALTVALAVLLFVLVLPVLRPGWAAGVAGLALCLGLVAWLSRGAQRLRAFEGQHIERWPAVRAAGLSRFMLRHCVLAMLLPGMLFLVGVQQLRLPTPGATSPVGWLVPLLYLAVPGVWTIWSTWRRLEKNYQLHLQQKG